MVSSTARVDVFHAVYNALNANLPTYTNKAGGTSTYKVLSSFPEATPVFPCIVVNPIIKRTRSLGVAWTGDNKAAKAEVEIEFFAKTSDEKNAVDSAIDSVEATLDDLQSDAFYLTGEPFEDSGIDILEVGGQKLNTATLTVNITIR